MAKYWIYLNGQVKGPYELEQLIRLPGFSRQSMISVDDYSGNTGKWISPAEIPEMARIFQKVDALHDAPVPSRPAPKPVKPKMPVRLTPVPPPVEEPKRFPWAWVIAFLLAGLAAAAAIYWTQTAQQRDRAEERRTAQSLIEMAPLPSSSPFSTLRQYLQTKQISSRWEFERLPSSLYNVTVSWMPPDAGASQMPVYAFEVNLQAQTVRGLNSAGSRLLAQGFPSSSPPKAAPAAAAPPKKSPGDLFPAAINDRMQSFTQGDFEAVWDCFSRHRRDEMSQGGINQTGYVRMQKLTYRLSPGLQQSIIKTKQDSETLRLVLIKQTQPKHPDIYIKQSWVWEEGAWKLDNEEKKMATMPTPATPESESAAPAEPDPAAHAPASSRSIPPGLPGFSDTASH